MASRLEAGAIGRRAVRELREMVAKYGAGEAEIAQAYFGRPRTPEQDAIWMTHQAARELGRVFQITEEINRSLGSLERAGSRQELAELFQKTIEELNHFNLVADLLERVTGKPVDFKEIRRYDLFAPDPMAPNNQANVKLAQTYRDIDKRIAELGNPAWSPLVQDQGLLEGGGNGLFYAASRLRGGELEERIADAMRVTLEDEVDHGPSHLAGLEQLVKTEEDLVQVKKLIRLLGEARLHFRNEEFGYPLSEQRLQEIMAGNIKPLPIFHEPPSP